MLWILLIVAALAGLAYGWIRVRTSNERISISLELASITPAIRKAKDGALAVIHRGRDFRGGHGQHT
jgi:hypothetical protein